MTHEGENISQAHALSKELKRVSQNVTPKDREEAKDQLKLSRSTISHYLNGKVRDSDTAVELILFFKKQIAKRDLVLLDSVSTKQVAHA